MHSVDELGGFRYTHYLILLPKEQYTHKQRQGGEQRSSVESQSWAAAGIHHVVDPSVFPAGTDSLTEKTDHSKAKT